MLAGIMQMKRLGQVYALLRWVLGVVFIYSGATKLASPQTFAVLIEAYGLVPEGLLMPMAVMLPAMELIAGVGLLADIRGSLAVITALLVIFIGILGYGIRMGLYVVCGCFGPEDPEAEAFHGLRTALYRDVRPRTVHSLMPVERVKHRLAVGFTRITGSSVVQPDK